MLDTVKDAFEMLKEEQEEFGQCDVEIDGMDVYAEATEQKKQESFERLAAKLDIF